MITVLLAPTVGYFLAKNKKFDNAIFCAIMSLSNLFVIMALKYSVTPDNATKPVSVTGVLPYTVLGANSMFAAIFVGLVSTELLIRFSKVKNFQIKMPASVPPAVMNGFKMMIPSILVTTIFGILAALTVGLLHTDFISLIATLIQQPFKRIGSNLFGYMFIYSCGDLLFFFGIHQSVLNGTLLGPLETMNITENMKAFAAHQPIPNIISGEFRMAYMQMGGTGMTLCLLMALFLFKKQIDYKPFDTVAKLSLGPGLFMINEPIIFGLPIVFNIPMLFPFILVPLVGGLIGYFATIIHFVEPLAIMTPWFTPPFVSGFLSSGGDWKVVVVQVIIFIVGTFLYYPFLKLAARTLKKQAELSPEPVDTAASDEAK